MLPPRARLYVGQSCYKALMPHKNPQERRAYARKWYSENKPKMVANSVNYRREVARPRNRAYVNDAKALVGCRRCGIKDHRVLDFHHLGDKDSAIAFAVQDGWSLKRIQAEIEKCVVLCANCHRIVHAEGDEAVVQPSEGVVPGVGVAV